MSDGHDCGVVADEIESGRRLLRNKQTEATVLPLLHQKRTSLQEHIYPLAKWLLAEKAGAFVGRYRLYWKLWRAEANLESLSDPL